jgi:hypothetical protein
MLVFVAITLKKKQGSEKKKGAKSDEFGIIGLFFSIFCHFAIISSH